MGVEEYRNGMDGGRGGAERKKGGVRVWAEFSRQPFPALALEYLEDCADKFILSHDSMKILSSMITSI